MITVNAVAVGKVSGFEAVLRAVAEGTGMPAASGTPGCP